MKEQTKSLKTEFIFLIISSLSIFLMIFLMPVNRVPDEANHARMAWQIVFPESQNSFKWMSEIDDGDRIEKNEYKELFLKKINLSNEKFKLNFKIKNLTHLPQLIGMLIGSAVYPSVGVIFLFGRIFNSLLYIIAIFFIIKNLVVGKKALCFISLLPIMIQQAASLSYDNMNFIAISFFFLVFTQLLQEKIISKQLLQKIVFSVIILAVTKTNNIILFLLLFSVGFMLPKSYTKVNKWLNKVYLFIHNHKKELYIFTILLVLLVATIVLHFKGGIINLIQVMLNTLFNNNMNGHLNTILTVGMFGYIGNFSIQFPLWIIFIDIIVLFILMYDNPNNLTVNHLSGKSSLIMVILQICMIIAGMYYSWTPIVMGNEALISVGAQGRYFTPFFIFFVPFLISYRDKANFTIDSKTSQKLLAGISCFNLLVMFYLIIIFYWIPFHQGDWLLKLRELVMF